MSAEAIDDPIEFLATLGGLQDAGIESVTLDVAEQVLYLFIDDLYANLEGRPDYPGERPCALVFLNVSGFRMDVDASDGLRISELRVNETAAGHTLEVDLNIGGVAGRARNITASFATMEIEDVED
nr:hypothetical protein [uncultured Dongia sp.]